MLGAMVLENRYGRPLWRCSITISLQPDEKPPLPPTERLSECGVNDVDTLLHSEERRGAAAPRDP